MDEPKQTLDDVLAAIDRDLPKIHRLARRRSCREPLVAAPPPTAAFSPIQLKRTQQAFQAMADDPILMESEEVETPRSEHLVHPGGNNTKSAD